MNDLSVWALVTAAVSMGVSWLSYFRDKPDADVIVFKEAIFPGANNNERYMSINITNTGRRPLTISSVGYQRLWQFKTTAVIVATNQLPKKLDEGDGVVCLFKRSEVLENGSWKGVAFVFASDTTGKQYRRNMAPFHLAWLHRYWARLLGPFMRGMHYFRHRKDD